MRGPKRAIRGLGLETALLVAVVSVGALASPTRVGPSLDIGGFEIGNGRSLTELLNPDGLHSFKIYSDFEYQIDGEKTIAEGVLAGGIADTRVEVGVEKDLAAISVERFLVESLKKGGTTIVRLGRF